MTCIYSAKSVETGTINGAQSAFQPETQWVPACAATTVAGGKFRTTHLSSFRGITCPTYSAERFESGGLPGAPCAICSTILISVLGARTQDGGKRMILKTSDRRSL